VDHDLNLQTEDVQDPQVAIWKDEYGICADELDVTIIRECKDMLNDEIIVSPSVPMAFLI